MRLSNTITTFTVSSASLHFHFITEQIINRCEASFDSSMLFSVLKPIHLVLRVEINHYIYLYYIHLSSLAWTQSPGSAVLRPASWQAH